MDKFDISERIRQKALDFLNANTDRPYTTTEIGERINYSRDAVCRAMRAMLEHGEVQKHGKPCAYTYTALKTKTYKASKARTRQRERETKPQKKSTVGHYINRIARPEDAPPYPCQGGQGAGVSYAWRRIEGAAS